MATPPELQIYVGRMHAAQFEAGGEYGCVYGPLWNPLQYGADVQVSYDHLVGLVRGLMLGRGGVIRVFNGLAEPVANEQSSTLIRLEPVAKETLDDLMVRIGWSQALEDSS